MTVTQLAFVFPTVPPKILKHIPKDPEWRECTELTKPMGFKHACFVGARLSDELDDQALFDVLWTADLTLSLNKTNCTLFTLELDGKAVRFNATQTNGAVYIDRANDF